MALFESDEKALQAVATGHAEAYIGNLTVASHIIHRRGLTALKIAAPSPFREQNLSMGIRSDWPELTSIINKTLASITEEEKTAIRNKYLAIKYEQGIDKAELVKWVLIVGCVALGIVLTFIFWNIRLSREIDKRKQTEGDLIVAKEAAETANRSKSIFLASMSHELRTPLNAILGFSGMLSRQRDVTADQQEKLEIINRSGEHLLAMINDVLDLSKIEAGNAELEELTFDLVALTEEIGAMLLTRVLGKGLSFTVQAEAVSIPHVKADVGKLRQILINLLNNAVKFTDEGGVTVRCDVVPIRDAMNRCHIVIEVEDTGPGIDPARQAMIFEPFVQGIDEPVRKGTGLGLSICKRYAELMGGTINVKSKAGMGALFRIRLPAKIVEAADIQTAAEPEPKVIGLVPDQKTWRILVADDNRENLLLLKSLLEEVGFVVLEAKNGQEAVEVFKTEPPDLVWMDMRMPVMDGYEATRRIRKWETRGQKTENRSQKTDFGERKEEDERLGRWEGENKSEIQSAKETADKNPKSGIRHPVSGIQEPESSIQHPASIDQRPETRNQRPVPIIAITASAFSEQGHEILAAGCNEMVIKPFKALEVFKVMGRFLDIDYLYEKEGEAEADQAPEVDLTGAMPAELPVGLLNELREATLALNREAISEVIDRIEPLAPDTAKGLRTLVDNFKIGRIRDLLGENDDA